MAWNVEGVGLRGPALPSGMTAPSSPELICDEHGPLALGRD